jgi:hypothetical protein
LCQNETVKRIAQKVGKNPGQVLLRWGLQHGCVVLPTSENPERIKVQGHPLSEKTSNVPALEDPTPLSSNSLSAASFTRVTLDFPFD